MTRIIPFLIFSLSHSLFGQTYYVSFDESCLDRYEFVTDIDKTPYVVYTSKVEGGKVLQFDVGKEETTWVNNLPGKLTKCSSLSINKATVLAINNSKAVLYIVNQSPTHYNVSKVEKATYIESNGERLDVTMADADFSLDLTKMLTNLNLRTPASQKDVYLDGTVKYQCLTGYIFKKMNSEKAQSFKEYTIIPGLGIVNKRSLPYAGAIVNSLRLDMVDDLSFVEFASNVCNGIDNSSSSSRVATSSQPEDYSVLVKDQTSTEAPTEYAANPCGVQPEQGIHYVQKGETIYSISRRYGVSVDQIKNWNGIGSQNIIKICQAIRVAPISGSKTKGKANARATDVAVSNNTGQFHIVKPNESLEQIAEMYGYTESRFRIMNSLGKYERVYAGQKLYTSDCDCADATTGVASGAPMPYDNTNMPKLTESGDPDVYFRPIKVHLVKPNETLFAIARQYDTTVDRIKELNGIEGKTKLIKDQRIYVQ